MPLSTRDFAQLTEELQDIYNESSSEAVADAVGLEVFDIGETSLLNYEHQILHGVSGIEEVAEGADLPKVNSEEGDNITYSQRYFGAIASITKKMRKFDLFDAMNDVISSLVDDAWEKIDQSLADILLYGWAASYTDIYGKSVANLGPDGNVLFKTAHTNGATSRQYNNIIYDATNYSPALSRTAIVSTIAQGNKFRDAVNVNRRIKFDTLLVGPTLEDLAHRIVSGDYINNSANWDPNSYVKNRIKEVKMWSRLDATGQGTDTSAYWFMYDGKKVKKSLKCKFSERPSLDAPEMVYDNKNWDYSLDYFYATGQGFQAYIRGSQGDNTSS